MERGGERHFTADGSDPKSPCPAESKNVNCGLECSFHAFQLSSAGRCSPLPGEMPENKFAWLVFRRTQRASPDLGR